MTFREITTNDMQAIFAVRVATWHNEHGLEELTRMGITQKSVRQRMEDSHRGWLCEVDGRVIGFAMGDRKTGEMWVIAVLREYEGQGAGKTLLALVEKWLRGEGWKEIWLTTDTDEGFHAVGFYRHQGWEDWKIEGGNRFMRKRFEPDGCSER